MKFHNSLTLDIAYKTNYLKIILKFLNAVKIRPLLYLQQKKLSLLISYIDRIHYSFILINSQIGITEEFSKYSNFITSLSKYMGDKYNTKKNIWKETLIEYCNEKAFDTFFEEYEKFSIDYFKNNDS